MTTVAFKDGVMAADKKMGYHSTTVTKIYTLSQGEYAGWLFGGSGTSFTIILKIKDWMEGLGEEPTVPDDANFSILLVDPEGNINAYHSSVYPIAIEEKFTAVGSGSDYAMGAMAMGATAEQAIGIAETYDASTGNGVDVLYI